MRQDWVASRKRAEEILARFDGGRGLSIRELAGIYHLSYMRVHQIIKAVHGNRRDKSQDSSVGAIPLKNKRSSR